VLLSAAEEQEAVRGGRGRRSGGVARGATGSYRLHSFRRSGPGGGRSLEVLEHGVISGHGGAWGDERLRS
jgi:hypothetical protein